MNIDTDTATPIPDEAIESLEAYLDSYEEGPEAALGRLEGKTDPDSINQSLRILIESKSYEDAASLVVGAELDEKWCIRAAFVAARQGETARVEEIIDWAGGLPDVSARRSCVLASCEGSFDRILNESGSRVPLLPGRLSDDERATFLSMLERLHCITDIVNANGRVSTPLEAQALVAAMNAHYLLGEQAEVKRFADLLAKRSPLPVEIGRAILQFGVPASPEIVDRLRKENDGEFEAGLLAAVIEGKCLDQTKTAFESALGLLRVANTPDERQSIFSVLYDFAQDIGGSALERADALAPQLLDQDSRAAQLHAVDKALRTGDLDAAAEGLKQTRDEDDPMWLQAAAMLHLHKGETSAALDFLVRASTMVAHPEMLRRLAAVAHEQKRDDIASEALEKLVALRPEDSNARQNLAFIYSSRSDFVHASEQFSALETLEPENAWHSTNAASSAALSGDLAKALELFQALTSGDAPPLPALLGHASILRAMDLPHDAFQLLTPFRDIYGQQPEFLMAFMGLGYASNAEEEANAAFRKLLELQSAGKTAPGLLEAVSLDDLQGKMHKHREHINTLHDGMVRGFMPWIDVEDSRGNASYWGWMARTQPMKWLSETPTARAEFTLYSTNGLVSHLVEGSKQLLAPLCPPAGSNVVADLSALITLHRLNLLPEACQYFGRITIPSRYIAHSLSERNKLLLHQESLHTSLLDVHRALDAGSLSVLDDAGTPGARPMAYIHEYTLGTDPEHYYRLIDLFEPLHKQGELDDKKYAQFCQNRHKPTGVDDEFPELTSGTAILVDLSALKSCAQSGVLDSVLRGFDVHITRDDRAEVAQGIRVIETQKDVFAWHTSLSEALHDETCFERATYSVPAGPKGLERLDEGISFCASLVAKEQGLPLLADDRVWQTVASNERPDMLDAGFGSDVLILALLDEGMIDLERAATSFLQLMRWRYRFVVPTPGILRSLALRHHSHPPGESLLDVATYVHECMRDPGLFSAIEPTDPPSSMALRLFHVWTTAISEFLVDVWLQDDAELASALTEWATAEFYPSIPKSIGVKGFVAMGTAVGTMALSSAVMHTVSSTDSKLCAKALGCIAEGLGLSQEEYFKIITGVLNVL